MLKGFTFKLYFAIRFSELSHGFFQKPSLSSTESSKSASTNPPPGAIDYDVSESNPPPGDMGFQDQELFAYDSDDQDN